MIPVGVAEHAALAAAGLAAGFLNIVAGGGSIITLPVLMMLGLPADVANGTNRLAIVSQSTTGTAAFQWLGRLDGRGVVWVIATSTVGAAGGALAATQLPAAVLRIVLLVAMAAMSLLILVMPQAIGARLDAGAEPRWATHRAAGILSLFAAGLYGGFIQVGVGFLLMATLGGLLRYDVVATAALKTVATLVFSAVALAIFAAADLVEWPIAGLLAVYTAVGALAGVRLAARAPHGLLRVLAFATAVATTIAAIVTA